MQHFSEMHCVDLDESFPTSIYLQNLASIQPRTSPKKFGKTGKRYFEISFALTPVRAFEIEGQATPVRLFRFEDGERFCCGAGGMPLGGSGFGIVGDGSFSSDGIPDGT